MTGLDAVLGVIRNADRDLLGKSEVSGLAVHVASFPDTISPMGKEGDAPRQMMYKEWPTILKGTWRYSGEVPCRVRIVRGDIRYGSGDGEDPQDIREDVPGDWYYVVYINSDGSETGGGCWESLEVARNAVSRLTGDSLVWDLP